MRKLTLLVLGLMLGFVMSAADPKYNYGEVLQKSIFFYECQQSGPKPDWNRVTWRGNSAMDDGKDVGVDLTGGWFDAGDHVKFNFPMAFSTTMLSWGALEFKEGYEKAGQMDELLLNLKFVNDYFIKCHTAPNELYGQVGEGGPDHTWWGSAEVYPAKIARPAFKIDAQNPGSDLAGETAAAMAASSMVFKAAGQTAYAAELLKHAKELFTFAKTYQGKYSESIKDASSFYNSWSGYKDELIWSALWLHKATGDATYLDYAKTNYDEYLEYDDARDVSKGHAYKWALAWDNKCYGCYTLMAQATGEAKYRQDVERHLDFWRGEKVNPNDKAAPYTRGGLAYVEPAKWGSLRYASGISFIALVYSDMAPAAKKQAYIDFATRQMNYALGDNPRKSSYVCGFGNNPPNAPHHRTMHGSWNDSKTSPVDSRHILYGALVGGPDTEDGFENDRGDYILNEVACDYNAAFTGCMAKMVDLYGGAGLANFPIEEQPVDEFITTTKENTAGAVFSEVAVHIHNRSAWPARMTDKLSFRYYVDLSEGFESGATLADYAATKNGAVGTVSGIKVCDEANHIYYVEVDLSGEEIAPTGQSNCYREVQLRVGFSDHASKYKWDASNDFSYEFVGPGEDRFGQRNDKVAIFDDGNYLAGIEHEGCAVGGFRPRAKFSATPTMGMNPLTVAVDASESTGPEGATLAYAWDFGDGSKGTGKTASHKYVDPGSYTITLTVSADGESSTKTAEITVKDKNSPPVASFTATPLSGAGPLEVNFDASTSYIANGEALTYSWNFGDGKSGTGKTATHTYTEYGQFTAVLTVAHATLGKDTYSTVITVRDPSLMGDIKAQFKMGNASADAIGAQFKIVNAGDEPVNMDELTLRYWFKSDLKSGMVFDLDYVHESIKSSNVSAKVVQMEKASEDANQYLEISFKAGTGQLAAKTTSGEIQGRLHLNPYANAFNPTADYSYTASTSFAEWEKVTVYQNGVLAYGIEPVVNTTPTASVSEKAEATVKVYPNPSRGESVNVALGSGEESVVTVYNLAGAVALQSSAQNQYTIPAGKLEAGIYVISVQSESVSENIKLVIK